MRQVAPGGGFCLLYLFLAMCDIFRDHWRGNTGYLGNSDCLFDLVWAISSDNRWATSVALASQLNQPPRQLRLGPLGWGYSTQTSCRLDGRFDLAAMAV